MSAGGFELLPKHRRGRRIQINIEEAQALSITYLIKTSCSSLNGGDVEISNSNSIKKISQDGVLYPYGSAQWLRRALRNQLAADGWKLSENDPAVVLKEGSTTYTAERPDLYIDDDLFGFMGTEKAVKKSAADGGKKGRSSKRTSPVRVSPLIALTPFEGSHDFGINHIPAGKGGNVVPYDTEIHSGFYRGTILIELDRIGCGQGFEKVPPQSQNLSSVEKTERVTALLKAIKNLWAPGRQTRFLSDISPKFLLATLTKVKNPVFLEALQLIDNEIDVSIIDEVRTDFEEEIIATVCGVRRGLFKQNMPGALSVGKAFSTIDSWIKTFFGVV